MTELGGERLFEAVQEALSRSMVDVDHASVRRRLLEARAAAVKPRQSARSRRALAVVALAAAAIAAFVWHRPAPATFEIAGRMGPIGGWLEAQPSGPLSLSFSEGSRVSLRTGSRGRVVRLSPEGARIELEHGTVTAAVVHRPDTDWTFRAGPFEVEVLGTELDVAWAPELGRFELRVMRGAVRVSGPMIAGGQEVRAGQLCRVDLARQVMEVGRTDAVEVAQRQPAPSLSATPRASASPLPPVPTTMPSQGVSTEATKPSWVALARAGKHQDAVTAAERAGLLNIYQSASAESLLELARAARLSGRPDLERAALLACREYGAGQPAAAQAAYLLGRSSPPAEAVSWFEVYLREEPRGLLAREASGRLIESCLAAGNRSGARRAASRYLAAYRDGPHSSMARQVLGSGERN